MSGAPLRLVVHVGAGKTGSSSIQATLRQKRRRLSAKGYAYWGMMLELAPCHLFPWQRTAGSHEFFRLNEKRRKEELQSVLLQASERAGKAGIHTAFWSNEWLFRRSNAIISALEELKKSGVQVDIVAYVRRPDAWLRSAYLQWGLKHKTYLGPLRTFKEWRKGDATRATFYKNLQPWLDAFPDQVTVRNLDAVGDVVADFIKLYSLPIVSSDILKKNETPSAEELYLRALYNSFLQERAPIAEFDKLMPLGKIDFSLTPQDYLHNLIPDPSELAQAAQEDGEDTEKLNALLESQGQPPVFTSELPDKNYSPDSNKLVSALSSIMIQQALRIENMEQKLSAIEKSDKGRGASVSFRKESGSVSQVDAPVFVISTGRSGSTLVQRLLNCHDELVVWGEHFGFLNGLIQSYMRMARPDQRLYPKTADSNGGPALMLPTLTDPAAPIEWVNPWSLEEFQEQVRSFAANYFGGRLQPDQRWGFKEIRYNNEPALVGLSQLFPRGRFVFVQRNPVEVARSKILAFLKEGRWDSLSDQGRRNRASEILDEVLEHYRLYESFSKKNQRKCFTIDYDRIVADPRSVMGEVLEHLNLKPKKYDWSLADQVSKNVITATRKDHNLLALIKEVYDEKIK